MKLINEEGTFYLDEMGERVRLTPRDLNLFRQMNPMGRRLALRKRAGEMLVSNPDDPQVRLIMRFTQLPAIEWSFIVPDRVGSGLGELFL